MQLELPDLLVGHIGKDEIVLDLAIGMYAANHLTLGQAAELAGISQGQMQRELGRRQIPAHYDLDDLTYDLRAANDVAGE